MMNEDKTMTLLTKENARALHGVGILMMIYHHLFIGGNTWYVTEGWSLLDALDRLSLGQADGFQLTFAWFCKICVAIFAFTSGYAMYVQFAKKTQKTTDLKSMYLYCFKRLWSFYRKYLLCFLFFITYDYLAGNQNGFDYSPVNYLLNLLGIRANYNGTWWYILIYYYMVLLSPIVYVLLNKLKFRHYLLLIGLFILSFAVAFFAGSFIDYAKFISKTVQNYIIIYLIIFMEGMFCGRYPILDLVSSWLHPLLSVLLFLATFVARALLIRAPSDSLFDIVFIVPFIISFTKMMNCSKKVTGAFAYIGTYSAYMWYAHAYFYSYLFFNLVFRSDLSLFVYLQVVVYSMAASIIFDRIERFLMKSFRKLFRKKDLKSA